MNHGLLVILSDPIGSGKSALPRAILGEIRPTEGADTTCPAAGGVLRSGAVAP